MVVRRRIHRLPPTAQLSFECPNSIQKNKPVSTGFVLSMDCINIVKKRNDMNKCYECKKSVATGLKLKSLFLAKEQYCANCGTALSFSLFWAVFFVLLSVLSSMVIGNYLGGNAASSNKWVRTLIVSIPVFSILGVLLTVSFLPLKPSKDRTDLILSIMKGGLILGCIWVVFILIGFLQG